MARYHDHVLNLYRLKTDAFEKALLTINSGALALSVTFLEKIAGAKRAWWGALFLGWGALIVGLLATLLTIYFSAESMFKSAEQYPWTDRGSDTGGRWSRATIAMNVLAISGTVIGIAALAVFSFKNLGGR